MKTTEGPFENPPLLLQAAGAFSDINQEVERRFAELYLDNSGKLEGKILGPCTPSSLDALNGF